MSDIIDKAPGSRAAALAAMESAAPAEQTAADAPPPPVKVEGLEQPTLLQEKPRGEDGKFLKKEARAAIAKAFGGDAPAPEATPEPEAKPNEEPEPSRKQVRDDIIAQRQMKAANQRRQEVLDQQEAELAKHRQQIEADRKRYAEAKKSPVAYLKELAKETGVPFWELYEQATLEMTGQNPKPVEPKTPLEKALFDKLAALEGKLTAREQQEAQQADQAKVQQSLNTFVTVVKTGAEKYPLMAKEAESDQREAALIYARRVHSEKGAWPTHDEVAAGLEAGLRRHYETNGSTEVEQLKQQLAAMEERLTSLTKTTPAATQGAPDRGNGAGLPAKPARSQTLSNGHAATTAAIAKELSLVDRRAAARRLLG